MQKEKERQEIQQYGRMWIWEGYFNPNNRDKWVAAAEKLMRINPHVLKDIEDFILLEGFKGKNVKNIKTFIEGDTNSRRLKKKNRTKDHEDDEKIEDKNRNFLNHMRPPNCWNFFEDGEKETPHVLRHDAKPQQCYIDGRVEDILNDI